MVVRGGLALTGAAAAVIIATNHAWLVPYTTGSGPVVLAVIIAAAAAVVATMWRTTTPAGPATCGHCGHASLSPRAQIMTSLLGLVFVVWLAYPLLARLT